MNDTYTIEADGESMTVVCSGHMLRLLFTSMVSSGLFGYVHVRWNGRKIMDSQAPAGSSPTSQKSSANVLVPFDEMTKRLAERSKHEYDTSDPNWFKPVIADLRQHAPCCVEGGKCLLCELPHEC